MAGEVTAFVPQGTPPATSTTTNPTPEQSQEWRNVEEVKRIIAQRDEYKAKLSSFEAAQAAHEAEKAQRREAEEQKRLAESGQYQEIIAKNEAKYKAEIASRDKAYAERMIPLFITAAASNLPNLTPAAKIDLAKLLRDDIRPDASGNPVVYENGIQKLDDRGLPYDPTQYVIDSAKSRSYMLLDTMPKSHGAAATTPAGAPKATFSQMMDAKDNAGLARFQETDPEGFRRALNEYTVTLSKKAREFKR